MPMNLVLAIGVMVVLGWLGGMIVRRAGLPAITGYLIAGLILGPSAFGLISQETLDDLSPVVPPLALGIIAYLIGGRLPVSSLRGLVGEILTITAVQAIAALVVVITLITLLGPLLTPLDLDAKSFLAMGLLAGAISLATAPAATLAIVDEKRSKGPLTTSLLGLVALDDALAVVAFTLALGAAILLLGGGEEVSPWLLFLEELGRLGLSVILGALLALPVLLIGRVAAGRRQRQVATLAIVVLSAGLAEWLGLFPLIANLVLGFVVVNRRPEGDLVGVIRELEGVVFVIFFTLAGAYFDVGAIRSAGTLAGLIIAGRTVGKVGGAWLGATLSGAPAVVRRWLGIALLPKAGVSVGLALLLLEVPELEEIGTVLVSAILASTLINELIAPPLVAFALSRSGEAGRA